MENRLDTDILTAENQPRNWLHTIERTNLPFEAVNPLTDVDKPETFAEGVAKRQLALRGSELIGSTLIRTGSGMIAYGSQRIPGVRSSHLLRKDTAGKPQPYKNKSRGLSENRPAPTRNNNFQGYERDVRSKSGTTRPSTRTRMRAPNMVRAGSGLVLAGGFIPVLGYAYVAHSVMFPEYDIIDDARSRPQRTVDESLAFGDSISNSWNSLGSTQQFVAKTALWALLS